MANKEVKRFYWLKLNKDFFKTHEIKVVEGMANGKDYILFYLKLLCESTSHNGELRFSDEIPYDEQMLSSLTNTNIDIVRSAVKVFTNLKLMEIWDDGTLFLSRVQEMIGSETQWAEKKRLYRGACKEIGQIEDNVPSVSDKSIENRDKSIEEKENEDTLLYNISSKEKTRQTFKKPTIEEVSQYVNEQGYQMDSKEFYDFYESNGWKVGRNSMKDWKASVRNWERNEKRRTQLSHRPSVGGATGIVV